MRCQAWLLFSCLTAAPVLAEESPSSSAEEFFEKSVRPLFVEKCIECHGPEAQEAGLRLDRAESLFRGGKSGPVVIPGKPDESRLIHLVRGDDKELSMPPSQRLAKEQIEIFERWVRDGAHWPGYDNAQPLPSRQGGPLFTDEQRAFWAFQPISRPQPPEIESGWIATPVDAFILEKLQQQGVSPSPPATKHQLIRRVTYDLTGLPPTPAEIETFLQDESPDAYQNLIERLLESKHYGEHWGRHWLDIARFAESAAHDGNNGYLYAFRYRDYVIDAFNEDKPYNEFIIEQLAGDLLPKSGDAATDLGRLIATGFLQVGPKPVVMRDKQQMLLDIADEQISTTGIAFLGLTLGCARCHDHKFDPIPTQDYYSLAGIFLSTHVMFDLAADSMWLEPEVPGADGAMVRVMAVQDQPQPANVRVHRRGSYRTLGDEAPRRFLQIIAGENHAPLKTSGSGRLEFAQWIAGEDNPLTARVMVNRVWQQHFGRGIVASADDFGTRGEQPTHPELLDWLARRFIESGWSIKDLHRLMVLSNTYRQSSNREPPATDPDNHLLSRMPRRRLSAEEIRDSLLAISGELDPRMGGTLFTSGYNFNRPDVKLSVVDIGSEESFAPYQAPRRTVYLPMLRNQMHPLLTLFDMANEHLPVIGRRESVVATQSLFWLNSPFVRSQAARLAERTCDLSDLPRIQSLWQRVLGHVPSETDIAAAQKFLEAYREELGLKAPPHGVPPITFAAQVRLTPGLVAWYRLNDGLLTNAVDPESAAGKAVGAVTFGVPGAIASEKPDAPRDSAISLNGVDQRIQFDRPPVNVSTNEITVEYWLKPESATAAMVVGLDDLAGGQRHWKSGLHLANVDGREQPVIFHEFFAHGQYRFVARPEAVVPVGQWSHVVFNFGKGRRQLFVNGKLVDEMPVDGTLATSPAPLTFGSRADNAEWFHGQIDEVAIYDRVLDAGQVQSHYQAGREGAFHAHRLSDLPAWQSYCQALFCLNEFLYVD